jgi:hypothetical protein
MTAQKTRRTISSRALLIGICIIALLAWGGLLLFTRFIAPQSVPSFLGFFALLSVALLCTLILLISLITRSLLIGRTTRLRLSQATRQAALISAWIIFNLLLRLLHSWSIFTAVVSFGIIVVIEFLALGRK